MSLARANFGPVLEGCPAVATLPGHLPDRVCSFDPADSETFPKTTRLQILDELLNGLPEVLPFLFGQLVPVTPEPFGHLIGRHRSLLTGLMPDSSRLYISRAT